MSARPVYLLLKLLVREKQKEEQISVVNYQTEVIWGMMLLCLSAKMNSDVSWKVG